MKLAHKRLTVLELGRELGSVSKACRQAGIDRTRKGADREAAAHGGTGGADKANPCFAKRHGVVTAKRASFAGYVLCRAPQGHWENLPALGRRCLRLLCLRLSAHQQAARSGGGGAAQAGLHAHNDVLPFYAEREIPVAKILTDNGREFCGTDAHPFELYLSLSDIRHKRTKVKSPRTNGFVERFHRTILDEIFRQTFRTKLYTSVEELQADMDVWLVYYNTERPHQSYRNMGRRPIDTINAFLQLPDRKERCLTQAASTSVSQEG